MSQCCPYLRPVFEKKTRRFIIDEACRGLKNLDFNAIAVRGLSGTLIGPIVADRLNKDIIVVRKRTDDCHSSWRVEGLSVIEEFTYVMLDDQIDSGSIRSSTTNTIIGLLNLYQNGRRRPCLTN